MIVNSAETYKHKERDERQNTVKTLKKHDWFTEAFRYLSITKLRSSTQFKNRNVAKHAELMTLH